MYQVAPVACSQWLLQKVCDGKWGEVRGRSLEVVGEGGGGGGS